MTPRPPSRAAARPLGRRSRTPWAVVGEARRRGREHWSSRLSRHEQQRLLALLRQSRGLPGTLGAPARLELQRLVDQLDLGTLVRGTWSSSTGGSPAGRALRGR